MDRHDLIELLDVWENFDLIIEKIQQQPRYLELLFDIALNSTYPNKWRAAWVADKINEKYPELVRPYIEELDTTLIPEIDSSTKRHILKLISLHPIPERHHSNLLNYCFDCMASAKEPVAVRVHAMQILYNISEQVPDLKPELLAIIQHELEIQESPAMKARGKKLSHQLHRQIRKSGLQFI